MTCIPKRASWRRGRAIRDGSPGRRRAVSDFETYLRAELRAAADLVEPTGTLAELRERIERRRPRARRWRLALDRARDAVNRAAAAL
jgi:hypothetical protein